MSPAGRSEREGDTRLRPWPGWPGPPTAAPSGPPWAPRRDSWIQLLLLVLSILLLVQLTALAGGLGTLAVIAAIFAMIMLHEFGHFVTAKRAGMKVTEFFVGFGPRLWSIRRGETEYGVKALPLGGYVRIVGMSNLEQIDPLDEPRSYRQQSFGSRLSVALAGSAMHLLIAFVLLLVLLSAIGVPNYNSPHPTLASVVAHSPAMSAGLRKGDRLLAIDNLPPQRWDKLVTYIQSKPGQTVRFRVQRGATILTVPVPLATHNPACKAVGFAGVSPDFPTRYLGPASATGESARAVVRLVGGAAATLGRFFSHLGAYTADLSKRSATEVPAANCSVPPAVGQSRGSGNGENVRFNSPVGIARLAGQAAGAGAGAVLELLIGLNVFVGVFNMLPVLPFDGGHVAIAVYERLRSRKRRYFADVRKMLPYSAAAVALLGFIFLTSLYSDIFNPSGNPFQ